MPTPTTRYFLSPSAVASVTKSPTPTLSVDAVMELTMSERPVPSAAYALSALPAVNCSPETCGYVFGSMPKTSMSVPFIWPLAIRSVATVPTPGVLRIPRVSCGPAPTLPPARMMLCGMTR